MTPQEVALKLTEAYFSRADISFLLKTEFEGKTSVEAYSYVFDQFFQIASKDIHENSKNLK